jgi:hypothetical protein
VRRPSPWNAAGAGAAGKGRRRGRVRRKNIASLRSAKTTHGQAASEDKLPGRSVKACSTKKSRLGRASFYGSSSPHPSRPVDFRCRPGLRWYADLSARSPRIGAPDATPVLNNCRRAPPRTP